MLTEGGENVLNMFHALEFVTHAFNFGFDMFLFCIPNGKYTANPRETYGNLVSMNIQSQSSQFLGQWTSE